MSDKQETIADIVAEMRMGNTGPYPFAYLIGRAGGPLVNVIEQVTVKELADRLEAAHKREVEGALNAGGFVEACRHKREVAQLREALKKAEAVIDGVRMMVLQGQEYDLDLVDFGGALAKCRDALAATETKGAES